MGSVRIISQARAVQLEADNAALRRDLQQLHRLKKAVRNVYAAGYWSCDRLDDAAAKQLFIELRDACGITPGESPTPIGLEDLP